VMLYFNVDYYLHDRHTLHAISEMKKGHKA
jgi:hypothetical protein